MKTIIISVIILTSINLFAQSEQQTKEKYLIENGRAGEFKVGDTLPNEGSYKEYFITKKIEQRIDEGGEWEQVIYEVSDGNETLLDLERSFEDTLLIGQIVVKSPRYKTKEGANVNSTISELRKLYPKIQYMFSYICGCYWMIQPEMEYLDLVFFELDRTSYIKPDFPEIRGEQQIEDPDNFKPESKIKGIRIL